MEAPSASPSGLRLSRLAREVYDALRVAKGGTLLRGSIAKKLRVGRWKTYSHHELERALDELGTAGLVVDDNHGRYTLTGGGR